MWGTFRKPPKGVNLAGVLRFKYQRTVAADNTIRFGQRRWQLLPSRERASYARARVEVQERLDGRLAVYYQGRVVASKPAPAEAPVLPARRRPRPAVSQPSVRPAGKTPAVVPLTKPAVDHPCEGAYGQNP